jgi:RNA polymerase sigma-70 factor (ECF subfamily)
VELDEASGELPTVAPEVLNEIDGATAVHSLTEVDEVFRVPLSLFYLEELSYKEIAQLLDVPIGTVMSRLSRGKEQLRNLLHEAHGRALGKMIAFPQEGAAS